MSIVQLPVGLAAQVGIDPATKKMVVTDNLTTITTAGYLNSGNLEGYSLSPRDVLEVLYSYNVTTNTGTFGIFTVSLSSNVITLVPYTTVLNKGTATISGTPGTVTLNKQAGVLTTPSLTTAAGFTYVITLTDSYISSNSVIVTTYAGGTNTVTNLAISAVAGNGTATITIFNQDPLSAFNGTIIFSFAIF